MENEGRTHDQGKQLEVQCRIDLQRLFPVIDLALLSPRLLLVLSGRHDDETCVENFTQRLGIAS